MPVDSIAFEADIVQIIKERFARWNLRPPKKNDLSSLLTDFLTINEKLIRSVPREVLYSPGFHEYLQTLPSHQKGIIQSITKRLKAGADINYHQSKKLLQSKFHDHLVYEWKIHHLHLSNTRKAKSYFVKPGDQLLFVYIDDNMAIFLGIDRHRPGVFADAKWIEILHDHFPDTIAHLRLDHISDVNPKVNAEERQTLWDKGYTLGMTKVKDTVYWSSGVGRSTSGHSMMVMKHVGQILRWHWKIKEQFTNHFDLICDSFNFNPSKSRFKVILGQQTFEVVEITTRSSILTCPTFFDIENE
ncbi:hypothetical protein [Halocola ammonii]